MLSEISSEDSGESTIVMEDNALVWSSSDENGSETMQLIYNHSNSSGPSIQIKSITVEYLTEGLEATLSEPIISGSNIFLDKSIVSISLPEDTPDGAEIRYTLDGNDPDNTSHLYTAPFELSQTATVKARILAGDLAPGPIASATFSKLEASPGRPTINSSTGSYNFTDNLSATLTADDGSKIFYTLDGNDPTFVLEDGEVRPTGSTQVYEAPINITTSLTLKAVCVAEGYGPGEVVAQVFTKIGISVPPTISGPLRFVGSAEISISTPNAPSATIYYTSDGSEPSDASILYTRPFTISETTTVRAVALEDGKALSDIAQATFTRIASTTSVPEITGFRLFTGTAQISITADAPVYYSFGEAPKFTLSADGEFTAAEGTYEYTSPFNISQSTTIYALCMKPGEAPGEVVSCSFTRLEPSTTPQIAGPEWFAESASIELSATENAAIFYALNDKEPEVYFDSDGNVHAGEDTKLYGAPISISETTVVKAIAVEPGKGPSETVARTFTKAGRAAQPTIEGWAFFDNEATVSIAGEGRIYYTTDNSEPTEKSILYATPFSLSETTTVRAIAYADGSAPSLTSLLTMKKLEPTERTAEIEGPTEFESSTTLRLFTSVPTDLIYYTLDGSDPQLFLNHTTGQYECTSPTHNYLYPFGVNRSTTLKIVVVAKGCAPGPVITHELTNTKHTPAPVINAPAFFIGSTTVSITASGDVFYTTEEAEPTENSTKYTEPFEITKTTTIRAIAKQADLQPSVIAKVTSTRLEQTESTPEIRGAAIFSDEAEITIITAPQTTAYYTLDGSAPTFDVAPDGSLLPRAGTQTYSTPFSISATTTVTAVCVAPGRAPGAAATVRFVKSGIAGAPEISGDSFFLSQTQISISTTEDAEIRYTLDGSEPTTNSKLYDGPFMLSESATLKARSFIDGYLPSSVVERRFTLLTPTPAVPTIEGERLFAESTRVAISAPAGCKVFYTLSGQKPELDLQPDGSFTPKAGTALYSAPFEISESVRISAVALATGHAPGEVTFADFVLTDYSDPVEIEGERFFITSTNVVLTAADNAEIHYTLDGATPTKESPVYSSPIRIETTTTIKAIAYQPGMLASDIVEQRFVRLEPTPGEVRIEGETRFLNSTVATISAPAEAKVYYTQTGQSPKLDLQPDGTFTAAEGTLLYTSPIEITQTMTVSAVALLPGFAPGPAVSASFVKTSLSDPVEITGARFFTDYTDVSLSAAPDAEIYFTSDGSDPDADSQKYTAPIRIEKTTTIKAIAIEAGKEPSVMAEAQLVRLEPTTADLRIEGESRFIDSATITIMADDNSKIYYTTDGTDPKLTLQPDGSFKPEKGTYLYADQFRITTTTEVRAVALGEGMAPGPIVTAHFSKTEVSASPEITGARYFLDSTTATLTAGTDAEIHYTLDGSTPDENSPKYLAPLTINKTTMLRAIAIEPNRFPSEVAEADFIRMELTTADLRIEGESRFINSATITILTDSNSKIYYTTDGTDPILTLQSDGSFLPDKGTYLYAGQFRITATTEVRAVALGEGMAPSRIVTAHFIKTEVSASPEIAGARYFLESTTVTLTAGTNAEIHYTLDGSTPDENSPKYSAPLTINKTVKLRAIAIKPDRLPSAVAEADFVRLEPTEAEVKIDGERKFIVSSPITLSATDECDIYFTTSGEDPELQLQPDGTFKPGEGTVLYANPFQITRTTVVAAVAVGKLKAPGNVVRVEFVKSAKSGTVSIEAPRFFIGSATVGITAPADAAVFYSTDGSTPDENSIEYTAPFEINATTTIRAIAIEPGKQPSDIAEIICRKLEPTAIKPTLPDGSTSAVIDDEADIELKATGCKIYYTIDGSAPALTLQGAGSFTPSGTTRLYDAPIRVYAPVDIRAVALSEGFAPSAESRISITIRDISEAPEIIGHPFFVDSHSVELAAKGAIYYTLDGSMPTPETATPYTDAITLTGDTHLRTIAVEDGKKPSADVERHFTALTRTAAPELPEESVFAHSVEITIKAPAGAEIYYTSDGSDPVFTIEHDGSITMASDCSRYSGPITLTQTTRISAVALLPGRAPSLVAGATYVRDDSSGIGKVTPDKAGVRVENAAIFAPEGSRIFDTAGHEHPIGRQLPKGVYIVRTPAGSVKVLL